MNQDGNNHPPLRKSVLNLTMAILLMAAWGLWPQSARADLVIKPQDKPYVEHLRIFASSGWTRKDFPGASPAARASLEEIWNTEKTYGTGIRVMSVLPWGKNSRVVFFYFKEWSDGIDPAAYAAEVDFDPSKKPAYLITAVNNTTIDMQAYLVKRYAESYREFSALFPVIDPTTLRFEPQSVFPIGYVKKPIPPRALETLSQNEHSGATYYAVGQYDYGSDLVAYIVVTPDCYSSTGTGLTLYIFDRKKAGSGQLWDDTPMGSRVRESDCGDAGEDWHTDGFFADLNGDHLVDLVTRRVDGGFDMDTGKAFPTTVDARKCLYVKDGKFTCDSLSPQGYDRLKKEATQKK